MSHRRIHDAVASSLRCQARVRLSPLGARCASHQADGRGPRIAVLGGGLTGLTTAYYLVKDLPATARVTVYEGADRVGGWVKTDRVDVDVGGVKGVVSFERGPRTLSSLHRNTYRYDDLVLYDLALDLGLKVETPTDKPRYIYYPDHLVPLPPFGRPLRLVREPLFLHSLGAFAGFVWRQLRKRHVPDEDVSASQWLRDISGSASLADNMGSAMIHGIYGGDIDRLSARSVFEEPYWSYYLSNLPKDVARMPMGEQAILAHLAENAEIQKMALKPKGSLMHFGKAGLESLPRALADALGGQDNADIKLNEPAVELNYNKSDKTIEVTSRKDSTLRKAVFDKVIATVPSKALAKITRTKLPSLKKTASVSIMTVNLWYPEEDIKPRGLGYLIPRAVPAEQNPERALGVFFDSDVATTLPPQEPRGTKLYVLMGGHHYTPSHPAPSESQAVEQAKALVERHLGIPRSTPCFAMASLARDCIPQHYVGHHDLVRGLKKELERGYAGKLAVAGGSYTRIGVMAALRSGFDVAKAVLEEAPRKAFKATGLEYMDNFGTFIGIPKEMIPVRRWGGKS